MPPVMDERQEINEVIEENDELAHFSESNFVFTDISTSVDDRVRNKLIFLYDILFLNVQIHIISILTPQKEIQFPGSGERREGAASVRPKNQKKYMKFNWNFQRVEVLEKIPSTGEAWILSETLQCRVVLTVITSRGICVAATCISMLVCSVDTGEVDR